VYYFTTIKLCVRCISRLTLACARELSADLTKTVSSNSMISFLYAPPERLRLGETHRTSDLYSLGLVLCFLLTGNHMSLCLAISAHLRRSNDDACVCVCNVMCV
jgi:serine/threonine protein kinase